MSTLWLESGDRWRSMTVAGETPVDGDAFGASGIRLFRFGQDSERGVGLLARHGLRVMVNGLPVQGGFLVLEHRDELLVAAPDTADGFVRLYFSNEATPTLSVFRKAAGARTVSCPVCRGALKDGDAVVQCPNCSRWFHQIEPADDKPGRRCWTFAERCRICNVQPTALTGGPVWTPDKEEP